MGNAPKICWALLWVRNASKIFTLKDPIHPSFGLFAIMFLSFVVDKTLNVRISNLQDFDDISTLGPTYQPSDAKFNVLTLFFMNECTDHWSIKWVWSLCWSSACNCPNFILSLINLLDVERVAIWCTTYSAVQHALFSGLVVSLSSDPQYFGWNMLGLVYVRPFVHPIDQHLRLC